MSGIRAGLRSAPLLALCAPALAMAQSAPSDHTYAIRYDLEDRVTGTIAPDPDGTGALTFAAVRNSYNAQGLVTKVETGTLATWQSEAVAPASWPSFTILTTVDIQYDLMGRKLRETVKGNTGVAASVVQYSYRAAGELECTAVRMNPAVYGSLPASACVLGTQGTAGPDRITRNVFNAKYQVLKIQKAVGTLQEQDYTTFTYTPNGKQETVTDANGTTAKFAYDGQDRLERWYFASKTTAGVASSTDFEEYGYDLNGNRTSLRKRDGSIVGYQYDALNRVTVKDVDASNVRTNLAATHKRDVHYGYDLRGLQTHARFDSASGEGLTTVYDGLGRVFSITVLMDGTSRQVSYLFDANGNRTRVKYPDGKAANYTFDGLDRMTTYLQGTTSLGTIAYNTRALRKTLTGGVLTGYSYDPIGRLSSIGHDLGGIATTHDVTFGLTYTPASQAATHTTNNDSYVYTGSAPTSRSYAVNGLNQYNSAGPRCFDYDDNGNLTADKNCTNPTDNSRVDYLYDVENRLVTVSGATSAGMRYDPMGRLYETTGAATTRFLYDGDELISEYDSAGNILRRYVHGPGNDDPLVWFEGSGVATTAMRHIRTNHQGSVIAIASSTGASVAINAYDEWGVPNGLTTATTADDNVGRFQYTGQAWIPELGMYHYKARIYSPTLGRFLQTDPIGYDDQVNLYAYVENDPVNMTDPEGQESVVLPLVGVQHTLNIIRDPVGTLKTDAVVASLLVAPEVLVLRGLSIAPRAISALRSFVGMRTTSNAYRAAAAGGENAGHLRILMSSKVSGVKSSLSKNLATIAEHKAKIANPAKGMTKGDPANPKDVANSINAWQRTINRAEKQADIARDELRRRGVR